VVTVTRVVVLTRVVVVGGMVVVVDVVVEIDVDVLVAAVVDGLLASPGPTRVQGAAAAF